MSKQNENVQLLAKYLNERGNHKLQKLEHGEKGYAIIRKNKTYAFEVDFEEITNKDFRLSHMQSFNGKDEIIIFYVGE